MDQNSGAASPDAIFSSWLVKFAAAVEHGSPDAVADAFDSDGYWKDMLGLTWAYDLFAGHAAIRKAFATHGSNGFGHIRASEENSPPRWARRGGRPIIEGFFRFSTASGWGIGFVRLVIDGAGDPKAWIMSTTLYGLDAAPERVGALRPSGDEFAQYLTTENWADRRAKEILYEDRDPEVIVVGAGHAALSLSARLKTMGVDVLLVDRNQRVGDTWRARYHSLSLHNPTYANDMPYLKFPENWPIWMPKDKLADWLESYARTFELNVWTATTVLSGEFDEASQTWSVIVRTANGSERKIKCRQLVFSTGISGSVPNIPDYPGIKDFTGEFVHTAGFSSGRRYEGKRALVIGTGNSGHDVAQDLTVNGAARVVMAQRGPTCVVSLRPTAETVFSVYSGEGSVDEKDLMASSIPYPMLIDTYKWLVNRARHNDEELICSLNAKGMKTYYGPDETGFHMMYLRGQGGYYIDVGCSRLIAEGRVEILDFDEIDTFVSDGIRLKDGSVETFDLIVSATGFRNMQENIRRILGDDVADRVGPVWGVDEAYNQRNIWCRTAQKAFWVMGGGMTEARMFSRMLALQIAAAIKGVLPERTIAAA